MDELKNIEIELENQQPFSELSYPDMGLEEWRQTKLTKGEGLIFSKTFLGFKTDVVLIKRGEYYGVVARAFALEGTNGSKKYEIKHGEKEELFPDYDSAMEYAVRESKKVEKFIYAILAPV